MLIDDKIRFCGPLPAATQKTGPRHSKNAGSLGFNGRKKWRKIAPRLRTATCNIVTAKIDLQGAQTLFDMGCGPGTRYRRRWLTNSRRFMALITVRGGRKVAARRAAALKGSTMSTGSSAPGKRTGSDLPRRDIAVASLLHSGG